MRFSTLDLYQNELTFQTSDKIIAGIDEVGIGPIAGPVVVAAVILNKNIFIEGINDSKQLSAITRESLAILIKENALAYAIAEISHTVIDRINILQAVLEGMRQVIHELKIKPQLCLIDGNKLPAVMEMDVKACIKGDETYVSIAAASIIAKVHRDNIMTDYDAIYPEYGFSKHKGYPTKQHLKALLEHGSCPIHRQSYAPVRQITI